VKICLDKTFYKLSCNTKVFFSQTVISPIHHSLVQIVLPNTDKQMMKSENREQRITRKFVKCFIQTDFHQYFISVVQDILYQGMVYW
jgi:hypothetical protein